jgi:phage tail protein X
MGAEPDQIRQQIVQTRTEMGDTIDAIGYKADVPARAKDKVTNTVERARDSLAGTMDSITDAVTGTATSVRDAAPDAQQISGQARQAVGVAQQNPLGLALGSIAAGFLLGMMLPATRLEDERMGAAADHVKDLAAEVGQDAMDHGKEMAQEAIDHGTEVAKVAAGTVQASAEGHVAELRDTAMEHVDSLKSDTTDRVADADLTSETTAERPRSI